MTDDVARGPVAGRAPTPGNSALSGFLSHVKVYGKAVIPGDLIQFGLYGSGVVILTSLVALLLPDPSAISNGRALFHWHTFLLLRAFEARLSGFLHMLAVPAIVCGLLLLGVDLYLAKVPTGEHSRLVVVGQAAACGVGGSLGLLFLVLLAVNLFIWLVIIVALVCLGFATLAVFLAALADG